MKDEQPTVYEAAAQMLLQEVLAARAALAMDGVDSSSYGDLETQLRSALAEILARAARREEERQASAGRLYQRWALEQIRGFDDDFAEAEKKAGEAAGLLRGGWGEERLVEVRDAVVARLLPINQNLLDLPVLEKYHQALDKGLKRLGDEGNHKRHVAEQTALTSKKSIMDFMGGRP